MSIIKIFGHLNPDTDSVCSAISYSYLKNKLGFNTKPYILGDLSKETKFVLNYFEVEQPEVLLKVENSDKVILVDHNEKKQSVENRDNSQILEVIDHHRISDFHTEVPLFFRSEPLGCTSTIIAKMFYENKVEIPKNIAGIMASAILSDTLIYTSPTTTKEDKKICEKLCKISKIESKEYGKKMFTESSSLDDLSDLDLINMDSKQFEINNYKICISQIITFDLIGVKKRFNSILEQMKKLCEENNYSLLVFVVTDLIKGGSEILTFGENKQLAKKAFGIDDKEESKFLDGVLSRKKQVVPMITDAIK